MALASDRVERIFAVVLNTAVDNQHSESFELAGLSLESIFFPACTGPPDLTIEVSHDGGSTWYQVREKGGGAVKVVINGAATAFWVAPSALAGLAPFWTPEFLLRLAVSVAQAGNRTFYILAR